LGSEGIGIAASWITERAMAVTGNQEYADSRFEPQESVMNAGVLFSLPALISQGLLKIFEVFRPLPNGFYGLHHIIIIFAFMLLCRIKNPEQLKKVPVGEFGKVIGLDRIPQVEYFRTKVKQITDQNRCDELQNVLSREWIKSMEESFFYIDGHVRIYSGEQANLPKHFVSRQKLCLSSTVEYYINEYDGMPLMVIMGELNEKLKVAIEEGIKKLKTTLKPLDPADKLKPHFTLVFDRESYEPLWFIKLWEEYRVAIITYRKNVKDKWDENLFNTTDVELLNNTVPMQLCEMGSLIQGRWFREVRKRSDSGHQSAIITTHPYLELKVIAAKMFVRWSQENFFKYVNENYDFDKMIEYGTIELRDPEMKIPNPKYKQLSTQLTNNKNKRARLQSNLLQNIEKDGIENIGDIKTISKYYKLIEDIDNYTHNIEELTATRKDTPTKIKVEDMAPELRYNKLKTESKKLKNLILMIDYRAESALYGMLPEFYDNAKKDGRQLLQDIFSSDADLLPDYQNKILRVRLHSLSTPRANVAVKNLCRILNETKTVYPFTELTLVFDTVAI
jgi:hypothetical protein